MNTEPLKPTVESILEQEEWDYITDLESNDWAFPDYVGNSWGDKD